MTAVPPAASPASPAPVRHAAFSGLAGVSRQDITPPPDIYARNWGAARHDAAEGIHRPLTLTALALRATAQAAPLILIAADLGWWRETAVERSIREPILAALKLDPADLILNLAHTHSGPGLSTTFADLPGGDKIAPYLDRLRAAALTAAKAAVAAATPATLEWTVARCDLAANRDLPDPAAPAKQPRTVCGFNPALPADDTVLVGRVSRPGGILATLVNYACHPVTLAWENRLVSPDYVGALREVIETETKAPCLFLQGASGELGPRQQYVGDTAIADRNGRQLGFAALSALTAMLPAERELAFTGVVESGAPLATWAARARAIGGDGGPVTTTASRAGCTDFAIKADYPPLAVIEQQLAQAVRQNDRVLSERLRRKRALRINLGDGARIAFPHFAWRLGEALLIGTPHEAYSRLQTELRRRFAPRTVVVLNLCNGSSGYLPPADLYGRDLYQVWQTPFDRGGLEQLIESCAASLQALIDAAPVTPNSSPATKPGE